MNTTLRSVTILLKTSRCYRCFDPVGREYPFMLRDEIWAETGAGTMVLCVGCTESCLRRQLVPADFNWCLFSPARRCQTLLYSARLRERMGLEPEPDEEYVARKYANAVKERDKK